MTVKLLSGDALTVLKTLADASVQCVVTSPPYYGLRDYGVDGQLGLERTPLAFLEALWGIFDEVGRVLRPDGSCFVNIGDSYAGSGRGPTGANGIGDQEQRQGFTGGRGSTSFKVARGDDPAWSNNQQRVGPVPGIPAKNLLLIPQRFAIGMQDRGWLVRSQIAWCKTSAMPESVRDRPTSAWESIWMFTKSRRYYYDADAVRQPSLQPLGVAKLTGSQSKTTAGGFTTNGTGASTLGTNQGAPTSNLRNYWLLGPEPSSLQHYAGFPTAIPRRCILAGSREGDTVLDPFLGSGTTALVADRLGRDAIGIELNPEYLEMSRARIDSDAPLWSEPVDVGPDFEQAALWGTP